MGPLTPQTRGGQPAAFVISGGPVALRVSFPPVVKSGNNGKNCLFASNCEAAL